MTATLILALALGQCATPIVTTPYVSTPYVATTPIVKEVLTPVAVYVPVASYGAVFTPPAPVAPAASGAVGGAELKQIADALRAIDSRLRALESARPAPAPPPAPPPPAPAPPVKPADPFGAPASAAPAGGPQVAAAPPAALEVVKTKCAQCHEGGNAAAKGGGLVLIEGGALSRLAAKDALRVGGSAYKGTMPPRSSGIAPLTDEEVAALMGHYAP